MRRLTFDPAIDSMPVWSPDGKRILFASSRNQIFALYLKNADGSQEEKLLDVDAHDKLDRYPYDWSRDGKYILYTRGTDLVVAALTDSKSRTFLPGPAVFRNSQFSPDGKWVAYASAESGKFEVYVTSFPEAHGKWQVSNTGGDQPRWRGDGKELFYLSTDSKIMAVPVKTGSNFDAGTPTALFQANPREMVATSELFSYDVSNDGQKFLVNASSKAAMAPMSVVLN